GAGRQPQAQPRWCLERVPHPRCLHPRRLAPVLRNDGDGEAHAMPSLPSRRRRLAAMVALTGLLAVVAVGTGRPAEDKWTRLIRTADTLARLGDATDAWSRGAAGRAARTAYLLAFHAAQDAMRGDRMAVVAQRLDGLGERELARHVRRASSELF